jgi:CRISPR-associated protein Csb2
LGRKRKEEGIVSAVLEIRYISGRVHGTPWGTSHNEGEVEFPPSPWRIARSLVSTWYERARELDEQTIRSLIEKLSVTPPSYLVPPFAPSHVRHYFPESSHLAGVDTSTAKVLDAFAVIDPNTPLRIEWDIDLTEAEASALAVLADRLPYLGRAESLVSARLVLGEETATTIPHARWVREGAPSTNTEKPLRLLCGTTPFAFEDLLNVPWKLRQKGFVFPPTARQTAFHAEQPLEWDQPRKRTKSQATTEVVVWRIKGKGRIPLTSAVGYCDLLRSTVLSAFSESEDETPWQILGKVDGNKSEHQHQHVHFLPIASLDANGDRGDRNDRGEAKFLDGLMAWFPTPVPKDLVATVTARSRLFAQNRDGAKDTRDARLFLQYAGPASGAASPAFQTSRVWQTLTPYAPARHIRTDNRMMRSLLGEINRSLEEIGKDPAESVEIYRPHHHALTFRRHRMKERLEDARRSLHLRLVFENPVSGPISIGALSHFGLGHFLPAGEPAIASPIAFQL